MNIKLGRCGLSQASSDQQPPGSSHIGPPLSSVCVSPESESLAPGSTQISDAQTRAASQPPPGVHGQVSLPTGQESPSSLAGAFSHPPASSESVKRIGGMPTRGDRM